MINEEIKGVSKKSSEDQVHHIMRSAAEKIHDSVRELNQDSKSIVNAAKFGLLMMQEAVKSLFDLLEDDKKDAGVSKDYEVVG